MRRHLTSNFHPAFLAATLVALLGVPPARAEVLAAQASGFVTRTQVFIAAPPARVYERLLRVGRWWSDEHTYSGAARQMKLAARPGGCWCEKLDDGGFIEHGRVVYVAPGKTLRLESALGPLHEAGGFGSMNVQLQSEAAGTKLTLTYVGSGFEPKQGLAPMAPLFDAVFGEQLQRLKRYVEKNDPDDSDD
jgi:uncharacterized protein YndB with AHSA1/START domain